MTLVVRVHGDEKAKALARQIKQRAPLLTCAACGKRDFGLVEQPDSEMRTWLVRSGNPFAPERTSAVAQPMISLICTNCGCLNEFAEAVIAGAESSAYGTDVD